MSITPNLPPLNRHASLRETVIEQLRAAIISGEMEEGVVYSAPALGKAFGVSPTPVREAMVELAQDGLVETVKNKGFRVRSVSDKELDDLAEVRLLLEPPSVVAVVGRVPSEGFAELRELAQRIVDAAEASDLAGYLMADREFHAGLLGYTGNDQLVALATSLRMRTRMYGLQSLIRQGLLAESAREHHELLNHMEAGDAEAVLGLMRRHIGHARGLWATGYDSAEADER
ncbi:GntR family transcriptional regulator [Saccharomonospora xinjiangensis]|uniref:Transcriptional regulator n=1 Tax=Saccharomonospora xinjiangensis XJ-54 TaxID=882086 RepID=I0UYU5_9PSEU|nr:GntR family transcriptional regulator [Saccharomonospora xinjiangensis]EID53048.1 transcriptional regulator [Saccharomonospora xinjiangensis XJ-54]